jgi:ribosomal protein S18 acetylase RimI-like enzyme
MPGLVVCEVGFATGSVNLTILIRPFMPADREAAIGLFQELNAFEHAISAESLTDRATAAVGQEEAESMLAEGDAVLLMAVADSEIAGMLLWYVADGESYLAENLRRYGKVDALVVGRAHRGVGIGNLLLAEAERLTRSRGLSRMMLHVIAGNDGAAEAYRRFGFKPHSTNMAKDLD